MPPYVFKNYIENLIKNNEIEILYSEWFFKPFFKKNNITSASFILIKKLV
jgi:hypothetical protein